MGYEISWLIPGSLLDRAELAHVLHGAGAQVVDRQTSTDDIEVEVRARDGQAHLGVLELHVGEPRSGSRQVVTESAIEECLFRDEPRHEASLEEEDPACWAPGSWTSIVELADHGDEVAIAGHGPALITLVPDDLERKVKFWPITSGDAWRSLEWERPCIAEVHHQGVHLWACGSPGLVFCRSVGESWRPLATGIPADAELVDIHVLGPDELLAVSRTGDLFHSHGGRARHVEGVRRPTDHGFGDGSFAVEDRARIRARGDEVWIANGSDHVYVWADGRARAVALPGVDEYDNVVHLDVGPDGMIWLASLTKSLRGDGIRWELLSAPSEDDYYAFQFTGVCAVAPGEAWLTGRIDDGSGEYQAGLYRVTGAAREPLSLGFQAGRLSSLVSLSRERLGMIASTRDPQLVGPDRSIPMPALVCIERPGPPRTRIRARSNRGDNGACWAAICEVGNQLARAFGGWVDPRS